MVWREWLVISMYLGFFFFTQRNFYSDYVIRSLFSWRLACCKQQGLVWTQSSLLHIRGSNWGCKTVWSWDRSAQRWMEVKEATTKGCIEASYDTILRLCCYLPDTSRMQDCTQQMVYFEFADVTWSVSLLEVSLGSVSLAWRALREIGVGQEYHWNWAP